MAPRKGLRVLLVVVIAVGALAAVGAAQGDDPAWATDVYEQLDRAASAYNADVEGGDFGTLERWLVRDARVNLYVEGPDGAVAAYTFRTDDRLRVHELRRGTADDPTLVVRTSRAIIDRVAAAPDKPAFVGRQVRHGEIRVHRVVTVGGLRFPVGVEHVIAGAAGVAVLTIAATKFSVDTLLSSLVATAKGVLEWLAGAAASIWQHVGGIATGLTILDQLGLMDDLRRAVDWVLVGVRRTVASVVTTLRRWLRLDREDAGGNGESTDRGST